MFTGIIEKIGLVQSLRIEKSAAGLAIETGISDLSLGESVAVNGVCLTVSEFTQSGLALFFLSPETLSRTNLGALKEGSRVNLERALTPETRLSGHVVQGHVDGLARLEKIEDQGGSYLMEIALPGPLARYCVEKGSIALNGVSLTINSLQASGASGECARLGFTLVPHTWNHTTFSRLKSGDAINIEVDVLAKYVERLCRPYLVH